MATIATLLILGDRDFLGNHLAEFGVQHHFNVHLSDSELGLQVDNVQYHYVGTDNHRNLEVVFQTVQPDYVILAPNPVDPDDVTANVKTMLLSSLNVLELSRQYRVKTVILAGSVAIYGAAYGDEIGHCEPTSAVGINTLALKGYVELYRDVYGLNVKMFLYDQVYGPNMPVDSDFARLWRAAQTHAPLEVYGSGLSRNYIHVYDLVELHYIALVVPGFPTVMNVGHPEAITNGDLARKLCHHWHCTGSLVISQPRKTSSSSTLNLARMLQYLPAPISLDLGLTTIVSV
jgi:nucleoside-diphosphate-sugar epimerase